MEISFWFVIGYFYLLYFIVVMVIESTTVKTEEELENRNKFIKYLESIWNWISKIINKGIETVFNGIKYLINLMRVQR